MTRRAENDNGLEPLPPISAAARPSARQAEEGTGAADARRVGNEPTAAAAPNGEQPWRWAPRPKPDPFTAAPSIGWQAARAHQRHRQQSRRAASSFAIAGKLNKRAADELAEHQRRQNCPLERAMLLLRSRGNRIVYRMSVHDGAHDLFFISGLGRDRTADELLELAAKVAA